MSKTNTLDVVPAAPLPYASFRELQAEHGKLLQQRHDRGDQPEFLIAVEAFIRRGQLTGVLLTNGDDRRIGQSLLNYWANALYRAGLEPPDASLAPCDPARAPSQREARPATSLRRLGGIGWLASPIGTRARWAGALAACVAVLALALGFVVIDSRNRISALTAQLAQQDQAFQQVRAQLDQRDQMVQQVLGQLERERQETVFISSAIGQPLQGTQPSAAGRLYVQPGSTHAVLVVRGLKPPAQGTVYQVFLATTDAQVPSNTFTVGPDGTVTLAIDAPAPVDRYAQVMVTVEPASGSLVPSGEVVLQASL